VVERVLRESLADDALREGATMLTTRAAGCAVSYPEPFAPTWQAVIAFLDEHLKRARRELPGGGAYSTDLSFGSPSLS
jgi:hypothetical protein